MKMKRGRDARATLEIARLWRVQRSSPLAKLVGITSKEPVMTSERTNAFSRRTVLRTAAATGAAAAVTSLSSSTARAAAEEAAAIIKNNNIKQTVCKWCYDGKVEPEKLFSEAAKMGYKGIDLVAQKDWPLLKKYNLVGTMTPSHPIEKGLNRKENWDECLKLIRDGINASAEAG